MINAEVVTMQDFDNEVIDVVLLINGSECWVKGFDDIEWEKANGFALELSTSFGLGTTIRDLEWGVDE